MTVTLVTPEHITMRLLDLAKGDFETGGVLLARPIWSPEGHLRLLVREFLEIPNDAYERREAQQMLIKSDGYVPALGLAASRECVPIWFHTHPGMGANPRPSRHDR